MQVETLQSGGLVSRDSNPSKELPKQSIKYLRSLGWTSTEVSKAAQLWVSEALEDELEIKRSNERPDSRNETPNELSSR
jgi:hypothetical protein